VGFGLILRVTRIFHVAHGAVFLLTAETYYYAVTTWHFGVPLAILACLVVSVGGGILIYLIAYRPLIRGRLSFLVGFVASLGVLTVITNVLSIVNGGGFLSFPSGVLTTQRLSLGGLQIPVGDIVGVVLGVLIIVGLQLWLSRTLSGRTIRAISDDRDLAAVYSVRTTAHDIVTMAVGSALLVPAAIIIPSLNGVDGSAALTVGTFAFTATIIGGVTSPVGTFVSAVVLGIIESVSVQWLPASWSQAVGLGIMVIVLLTRPGGLFSRNAGQSVLAERSS
jgi:branched-chain amino acid transport system permease protein